MVHWKRNYMYFFRAASTHATHNYAPQKHYWKVIGDFCREYNCTYSMDDNLVSCSEEDFTIIMLKCPEAVEMVYCCEKSIND